MSKKKAKAPEPAGESAPMWIVSFADLVTLLMSFFVVLYALKQGGAAQQAATAAAIAVQFGADAPPADATDAVSLEMDRRMGRPLPPMTHDRGRDDNPPKGAEGRDPQVTKIRDGKEITSGATIEFAQGSAQVSPEADKVASQIAELVRGQLNILLIKGHISADEAALRPDDPNGMILSMQRAEAVADKLAADGIDRRILRPVACGPFEPLKTATYTSETQAANRRAEVFSTEATEAEYAPVLTVPAAPATASAPATAPN
jgi:chemotaxis protein MotB